MSFVLDASVGLAWCFDDEATAASDAILERARAENVHAPALLPLELANALTTAERRGRITSRQTATFVSLLGELDLRIERTSMAQAFGPIRDLVRRHRLTAYDAAYLDLALRARLPLATRDTSLQGAAEQEGVALLPA